MPAPHLDSTRHSEFTNMHPQIGVTYDTCDIIRPNNNIHNAGHNTCNFNVNVNALPRRTSNHLPERQPYSGAFRGASWNPRAFFARNGVQMNRRINKVRSANVDFFGLQETHSFPARAAALQHEFPQHMLYWSHCSRQRGGLALCISHSFLTKFATATWVQVEPGRIGKLQLRGRQGSLDLYTLYLDDQSADARRNSMSLLSKCLESRQHVLSAVFGDFNFVEQDIDRWCKTSSTFTGKKDSVDAKTFREIVLERHGLFELQQQHHTYEGGRALSKLDRVYVNWHASEQLDRFVECTAASWLMVCQITAPFISGDAALVNQHHFPKSASRSKHGLLKIPPGPLG